MGRSGEGGCEEERVKRNGGGRQGRKRFRVKTGGWRRYGGREEKGDTCTSEELIQA